MVRSLFFVLYGLVGLLFAQSSLLNYNDDAFRMLNNSALDTFSAVEIALTVADEIVPEKKSVGKALLLSLLLPGAGEYYAGETGQARLFFGLEAAAWAAWLFNRSYYYSLRKDYRAYAATHAALGDGVKDDQFWIDIGKFDDVYAFNEKRLQDRRPDRLYDPDELGWQWDDHENRLTYDRHRLRATGIKDRQIIFASAIVLNHLVSAVNGLRLVKRYNARLARGGGYRFYVHAPATGDGLTLGLTARF